MALRGPNFDGHGFTAQAVARGARALLLERRAEAVPGLVRALPSSVAVAVHGDPRRALGELGAWYRSTLTATVLGITGSCGKTTTKNIVRELFTPFFPVVASPSSFNNDIGVPSTLCLASRATHLLAVELGTNHPGEIAALCRIARPDAGIITNVGASHLAGLGSLEGVAREKGELASALPLGGFLVLNAACRYRAEFEARTRARVVTFSVEGSGKEQGELDARALVFHSGGTTFRLGEHEVTSPLLGTHNVENLLAALAVGLGLGIPVAELLPLVPSISGAPSRLERIELGSLTLFDDSYNANPQSVRAAVRVLAGVQGCSRRVLVLGDLLELGEDSAELHRKLGREAASAGIDALLGVGQLVEAALEGAREAGLEERALARFSTAAEAAAAVNELLRPGDAVLVKGSRAMGLEAVVQAIRERWSGLEPS